MISPRLILQFKARLGVVETAVLEVSLREVSSLLTHAKIGFQMHSDAMAVLISDSLHSNLEKRSVC